MLQGVSSALQADVRLLDHLRSAGRGPFGVQGSRKWFCLDRGSFSFTHSLTDEHTHTSVKVEPVKTGGSVCMVPISSSCDCLLCISLVDKIPTLKSPTLGFPHQQRD
ncbi:hypothetical protein AMECASPLE_028009 [Ameca splendens]|uniref:Uncharacterized protein n=1 Tax=Ameca splendens TaxID=208324 RepID=A0ABV1ACK0_9TELE